MNELVTTWGGWAVALLSVVGTGLFSIFGKKTSLEHQLIDQLQEQIDKQDGKLERVDKKVDGLRAEIRWRDDYILVLRRWIEEGKKPPPPPWPEGQR